MGVRILLKKGWCENRNNVCKIFRKVLELVNINFIKIRIFGFFGYKKIGDN